MQGKARRLNTAEMHSIQAMLREIFSSPEAVQKLHDDLTELNDENALQWQKFYEYHPEKAIRAIWLAFGFEGMLKSQLKEKQNPLEVIKQDGFFSPEEWSKHRYAIASPVLLISAFLSQAYDMECVSKHGVHMYDMLKLGKKGDDQAFLNAIKIDPAIMHTHSITIRFNRSLKRKDDPFKTESLKAALSGKNGRHQIHRRHMRTFFHIFIENGQIDEIKNEEFQTLFAELGIIDAHTDNLDNIKSLKAKTQNIMKNSK